MSVAVIALGNVPQWISALAATLILLGAALVLFRGRRTDVEVTGQAHRVHADSFVLNLQVKINPVGSLKTAPLGPTACDGCLQGRFYPDGHHALKVKETWYAKERCHLVDAAPEYKRLDWRLPTPRKRGGGMAKRRAKWGCQNRRLPYVEIHEVRLAGINADQPLERPQETLACVAVNVLRGPVSSDPWHHLSSSGRTPKIASTIESKIDVPIQWKELLLQDFQAE